MEDDYSPPPLSLKQKLKHSLCFSFTCCFRRRNHHHHPLHPPPPFPSDANPSLLWVNPNQPSSQDPSNFKEKCKTILGNFVNPMNKHRRCSSTEFRYDPLSYSLNFEDGFGDEAPLRNFSERLPPSPTEEKGTVVVKEVGMREITAVG
ncbi:hypothetical protein LIER_14840 [Lithospermum erythrorhizon]|uniref:Uncharacterized protein n=1 Tax=Lithospermum erythrorhizon TaxID=34254 RepID=A0AAV3Q266_LITER